MGALSFVDRRLHGLDGNGRSCADCHVPTDHFQLSPADVERRFQLRNFRRRFDKSFDDPLFRPMVDHDIQLFKFILVVIPPGPLPPVISSDGVNLDLQLVPSERAALLAYLRKL